MNSENSLTFTKFNDLLNEEGSEVYIELKNKIPTSKGNLSPLSFDEIKQKAKIDPELEIGWLVKEGILVIDIDDRSTADIVLDIIKKRNEKVLVCKTTRGIHIYTKSDFNKKTTDNILACGAFADTIVHGNGKSYITTPFKNPKINTSKTLANREVVHFNGIEETPFWLKPTFKSSRKKEDAIIGFPHTDVRNDSLNRQLWRLKSSSLTAKQREETMRIINDYILQTPLDDEELSNTILREENNKDLPQKEFFSQSGSFLHNKLGDFLIDYINIKKGEGSDSLYHYNEEKNIYEANEEYLKGQMTILIPQLQNHQKNEVLHYLNSKLELSKTSFNNNPYTIVFKNGVLDLTTFEFKDHSPNHLETIQINADFNPSAKSETVDEFFKTATDDNEDLITLLYESIGYSMLKTVDMASCFILTGAGRNGKSTFLDLIKEVVGKENSTSVDFKELGRNFGIGGLANKLVSLAGDISNQRINDSDMFKKIVAGDMVRVDEKYEKKYDTVLFSTLFFSANELPRSPDTTDAFYRRLVIIPFNANLEKVSKVEGMLFKKKLLDKESLEYTAYKAVMAIKQVLDTSQDFTEPDVCKEEKQKYKILNSSVLTWETERDEDIIGQESNSLYEEYEVWTDMNGYKPVGKSRFDRELCNELKLELEDGKFKKR